MNIGRGLVFNNIGTSQHDITCYVNNWIILYQGKMNNNFQI